MKGSDFMKTVREKTPLVHHITNYVTVNDCANVTICAGGSPVMSDEAKDIVDITRISSAVVLNMGTLNERTVESIIISGRIANENGIPVVFDPVGAGASAYRNEVADRVLREVRVDVIKGNAGEIGVLSGIGGEVRGVDSVSSSNERLATEALAKKYGCVVAMTGKTDYVSDGERTVVLNNGHDLMGCVSGTGCMVSSVVGCYVGANGVSVDSVAAAISAFSIAGEVAAGISNGPGTFKVNMLDSLFNLTCERFDELRKVE
ncbi:MAG: hydroxyethylthiazole kinase [Candidatus Methanomethylophilaceae archaeon]